MVCPSRSHCYTLPSRRSVHCSTFHRPPALRYCNFILFRSLCPPTVSRRCGAVWDFSARACANPVIWHIHFVLSGSWRQPAVIKDAQSPASSIRKLVGTSLARLLVVLSLKRESFEHFVTSTIYGIQISSPPNEPVCDIPGPRCQSGGGKRND